MSSVTFDHFANIIEGKLSDTKRTRHGVNPSTLESLEPVPVSESADVDLAVSAAQKAAPAWAQVPLAERQKAVVRYADAIEAQAEDFAKLLVREQGKAFSAASGEVKECVNFLRGIAKIPFSEEEEIEDNAERRVVTRYVPIGVSVGIVPWNFPIMLCMWPLRVPEPVSLTFFSRLVQGSAGIDSRVPLDSQAFSTSPFTPYSALKLVELAQSFFPPGILQALSGDDSLGPLLTVHPGINKVSFTGSTATGRKVMESCSKSLKRVTLELGGNDPAIICSDVDVASVAQKVAALALYNSGQVCVAIKRIYVHSTIYRDFLRALVEVAASLVVGDGFDESTFLGPIQNAIQYERVQEIIRSVRDGNLELALGEPETAKAPGKGYFLNPIIVDNPPEDSRVVKEEPFGPIFPVLRWDTEDDVIQRANDTDMGLGASIWTRDSEQAERLSRRIEAGNIWINSHLAIQPNAPFGGHKSSGIGSELGIDGIKSYCNTQSVYTYK
ncbi:hypothetical protein ACJZ2D_011701 [Fusarium nematophilum]